MPASGTRAPSALAIGPGRALFSLLACGASLTVGCFSLDAKGERPRHRTLELRSPLELAFDGRNEVVHELASIEVPRPFHEVLVSWNARTTPRAGLIFALRVGRDSDGWSPWLHVGDWNTSTPANARTEFESGRIAVDYFTSDVYWSRAQVRLLVRFADAADEREKVTVDRLDLCFTDRDVLPDLDARTPRPIAPIEVPRLSQFDAEEALAPRICSPTSLAMVLGYGGVAVTPASVAARAYDPVHDLYGNWTRSVQTAYSFGIAGFLTRFVSWRGVARELLEGRPVILSVAFGEGELAGAPMDASDGHLVVVVGFDEEGDVIVHDPAARGGDVRRVYRQSELLRAWQGHGGTALVLEVPPSAGS